jgi:hypothetical protein
LPFATNANDVWRKVLEHYINWLWARQEVPYFWSGA